MLENTAPPPTTAPAIFLPAAAHINIPCPAQPERNRTGNRAVRRRRTQTGIPTDSPQLDWSRQALRACDLLAGVQSISSSDRALVAFAIEWAPYGGADAEELFIKFGVQRNSPGNPHPGTTTSRVHSNRNPNFAANTPHGGR
jgi:hypothetical protein